MKLTPRECWIVGDILGRPVLPQRRTPRRWHRGPMRDARYLAWIRTQPSVVSGDGPCEAAHTGDLGSNGGGTALKASDWTCCPLTMREHREYHRIGKRAFERKYCIDFEAHCQRLRYEYSKLGGRVAI